MRLYPPKIPDNADETLTEQRAVNRNSQLGRVLNDVINSQVCCVSYRQEC